MSVDDDGRMKSSIYFTFMIDGDVLAQIIIAKTVMMSSRCRPDLFPRCYFFFNFLRLPRIHPSSDPYEAAHRALYMLACLSVQHNKALQPYKHPIDPAKIDILQEWHLLARYGVRRLFII